MERIKTVIKKVGAITLHEREQMLSLVQSYYAELNEAIFLRKLTQKDLIVFLKDKELIIGFTAIELINFVFNGEQIKIVLAEETVISKEYWHQQNLSLLWLQPIFALREQEKHKKWYWIVPASNYLSYQAMTLFFPEFYPRRNQVMPSKMKQLVHDFSRWKYKQGFDAVKGTVSFKNLGISLTKELSDVMFEKFDDPHMRYFISKNPYYHQGDHLICLAEINQENITPFGESILKQKDLLQK